MIILDVIVILLCVVIVGVALWASFLTVLFLFFVVFAVGVVW